MATDVVEVDAATGETIERDFTPDEKAQRKADEAAATLAASEAEAAAQAKEQARASAMAKLEKLGLTVGDLTALGL